jgi:hypothetical protein
VFPRRYSVVGRVLHLEKQGARLAGVGSKIAGGVTKIGESFGYLGVVLAGAAVPGLG